ncbi:hypothetical protein C8R46DRAFT_1082326 [Mycena filopes]|nr:hypothetical protein C8R46DRAFT_1082326 [Mycena filopes]
MLSPWQRRINSFNSALESLAFPTGRASLLISSLSLRICMLSDSAFHAIHLSTADVTRPPFTAITHLQILQSRIDSVLPLLANIQTLPLLTHLALEVYIPRDDVLPVLAQCSRLHLSLILLRRAGRDKLDTTAVAHPLDVRFVVARYDGYRAEWEAGAKGLPDLWSRGDDFVARKRKGEIEATRYWMD